jgi:hypothetical protein
MSLYISDHWRRLKNFLRQEAVTSSGILFTYLFVKGRSRYLRLYGLEWYGGYPTKRCRRKWLWHFPGRTEEQISVDISCPGSEVWAQDLAKKKETLLSLYRDFWWQSTDHWKGWVYIQYFKWISRGGTINFFRNEPPFLVVIYLSVNKWLSHNNSEFVNVVSQYGSLSAVFGF